MLTRFYADNFKCLQNFQLELDAFTLLTGPNGSGKTAVLEAIRGLADLLTQRDTTEKLFPVNTLTRWDTRSEQLFEFDVRLPETGSGAEQLAGGLYRYRLRISHDRLREKNRVAEEELTFEGRRLYRSWLDETDRGGTPSFRAQLFKDSGQEGPMVLMDWSYSGVGRIEPRVENRYLQLFRRFFEHLVIVGLNPNSVSAETRKEEPMVAFDGGNFAAWLLHILSGEALACREAEQSLKDGMLPELALFQMETEGSLRIAKAIFRAMGQEIPLRLDELSAGQRVMIILEHALAVAKRWGSAIVIDEPANFLALREIQPLLHRIHDATIEGGMQAILTSHHPMSLDLFAEESGRWLERTALGATRCERVSTLVERASDTAIPLSELVARGWVQTPASAQTAEREAGVR
jgi:energy-coupling factor transporter ATP-binding protein EcfA2